MKLTAEIKRNAAVGSMQQKRTIYIKPQNRGYACYCSNCGNNYYVNKNQLSEMRNSHICPCCWHGVSKIKNVSEEIFKDWFYVVDGEAADGYSIFFQWSFDKPIHIKVKHVAHFTDINTDNMYTSVKDIHIGPFGYSINFDYNPTGKYKRRTKCDKYFNLMFPVTEKEERYCTCNNKKIYLKTTIGEYPVKSTQAKIAKDHILNPMQLQRMIMFNLNDYEAVRKMNYKKDCYYYDEQHLYSTVMACLDLKLNKFDAMYLKENGVGITDYRDYLRECKELGIRNKHPKDFDDAHRRTSILARNAEQMKEAENKRDWNKSIQYISKLIPAFKDNNLTIAPIKSIEDLSDNSVYMQNCIFGYAEKYSTGGCLLFAVTDPCGNLIADVETNNNRLIQVRGRFNENVSKRVKNAVTKMISLTDLKLYQEKAMMNAKKTI